MEILIGSVVAFLAVTGLLLLVQMLRRAPMPVGCTPVNGTCCRNPDGCTASGRSTNAPGPGVHHADP